MASSGDASFLYSVGVDLSKANADLQQWTRSTVPTMMKDLPQVEIRVGYSAAKTNIQNFVNYARTALKDIPPINVSFNFSGASRSLNAFIGNFKRNAAAITELDAAMGRLQQRGEGLSSAFAGYSNGISGFRESLRGAGQQAGIVATETERVGATAEKSTTAIDFLGKIASATAFRFVEWGIAIKALDSGIEGFHNAIQLAGEVQMEETLQQLPSDHGSAAWRVVVRRGSHAHSTRRRNSHRSE